MRESRTAWGLSSFRYYFDEMRPNTCCSANRSTAREHTAPRGGNPRPVQLRELAGAGPAARRVPARAACSRRSQGSLPQHMFVHSRRNEVTK